MTYTPLSTISFALMWSVFLGLFLVIGYQLFEFCNQFDSSRLCGPAFPLFGAFLALLALSASVGRMMRAIQE